MSAEEEAARYREIAAAEREKAEAETLPQVCAQLLRSAEQWDKMASRAEEAVARRSRRHPLPLGALGDI